MRFLLIALKFSMACERNLYHANRFPAYPTVSFIYLDTLFYEG